MPSSKEQDVNLKTNSTLNVEYKKVFITRKIESQTIEYNIIQDFKSLIIIEDIEFPYLTGTLIFTDKTRIFEALPLLGTEEITIVMRSTFTQSTDIELKFSILNYELFQTGKDIDVSMSIVQSNWKNFLIERSISFNKNNNTDIANFVKQYGITNLDFEKVFIEDGDVSINPSSFAFPFMTFLDKLDVINKYFISKNKFNNYLFYTTLLSWSQKTANYYTLGNLFTYKPITFFYEDTPETSKYNAAFFDKYELSTPNFQGLRNLKSVGSINHKFDFKTKQIETIEKTYEDVIKNYPSLTPFSSVEKTFGETRENNTYAPDMYSQEINILHSLLDNYYGVKIKIVGLLERYCGSVATMYFRERTTKSPYHEQLKGNYLIKTIVHNFSQNTYFQSITLLRSGMNLKVSDDLISLTKDLNTEEFDANLGVK